jgi:glutamine amidotransferase
MMQLLAAMATDSEHMPSLMYALRGLLDAAPPAQEGVSDVFGLGYYADERALTMRKPGDLLERRSLYELAAKVKSSVVIATVERRPKDNTQSAPHRFRRWLFTALGDLSVLSVLRPKIIDALPGFIRSELQDANPSELAFGMFLRELHERGQIDDILLEPRLYAESMKRTVEMMRALAHEAGVSGPEASFGATNGRAVIAGRHGPALYTKRQEGLEAVPEGPLDPDLHDVQLVVEALKRFRAVVVSSGSSGSPGPDWKEIPMNTTFWIDRSLNTGQV